MIENWADDETILTDAFSNVSIFIITKNEEVNIARCLDSVRWSNDVVILDALSSDRTVALAASYPNVRLFSRPFTNYSDQRNYGLHSIRYRNNWVLVVDADEVVELALADEVRAIARFQPPRCSSRLFRATHSMSTWYSASAEPQRKLLDYAPGSTAMGQLLRPRSREGHGSRYRRQTEKCFATSSVRQRH